MRSDNITIAVDGLRLNGTLYIPQNGKLHYPAVCICHGLPAGPYNPSGSHYPVVAEKFCREGFVTLIFNFRGAGYSEGNFELSGWTQDLEAAVDLLCAINEVNTAKITVIGFSAGAAVGICTAAADKRIASVVAMACPADFSMMRREEAAETAAHFREIGIIRDPDYPESIDSWYEGFINVSAIKCVEGIGPRPLLLVHGIKDDVVPFEHAQRLYKKAEGFGTLRVLEEAGHRLSRDDEAVNIALEWIKRTLHIDHDSAKDL